MARPRSSRPAACSSRCSPRPSRRASSGTAPTWASARCSSSRTPGGGPVPSPTSSPRASTSWTRSRARTWSSPTTTARSSACCCATPSPVRSAGWVSWATRGTRARTWPRSPRWGCHPRTSRGCTGRSGSTSARAPRRRSPSPRSPGCWPTATAAAAASRPRAEGMTDLLLGADIGTSGLKLVALAADGSVVAEAEAGYEPQRPRPGWVQDDVGTWTAALDDALTRLALPAGRVRGLGLSGQMHGAVLVDEGGTALGPALLWADSRAAEELRRWRDLPAADRAALANPLVPGMTGPLLAWLAAHEPRTVERAAAVLLPNDAVRARLAPGRHPAVDARRGPGGDGPQRALRDAARGRPRRRLVRGGGGRCRRRPAAAAGGPPLHGRRRHRPAARRRRAGRGRWRGHPAGSARLRGRRRGAGEPGHRRAAPPAARGPGSGRRPAGAPLRRRRGRLVRHGRAAERRIGVGVGARRARHVVAGVLRGRGVRGAGCRGRAVPA